MPVKFFKCYSPLCSFPWMLWLSKHSFFNWDSVLSTMADLRFWKRGSTAHERFNCISARARGQGHMCTIKTIKRGVLWNTRNPWIRHFSMSQCIPHWYLTNSLSLTIMQTTGRNRCFASFRHHEHWVAIDQAKANNSDKKDTEGFI